MAALMPDLSPHARQGISVSESEDIRLTIKRKYRQNFIYRQAAIYEDLFYRHSDNTLLRTSFAAHHQSNCHLIPIFKAPLSDRSRQSLVFGKHKKVAFYYT